MGRSAGPGSPIFFHCPVARRNRDFRTWALPPGHAVHRTGKVKPYNPSRARGLRSLLESHEYICECGHRGWSNHKDMLNKPVDVDGWRKAKGYTDV